MWLNDKFSCVNKNSNFVFCIPSIKYCTDNAAMLACAGYYRFMKNNKVDSLDMNADSAMELETILRSND